MPYKVTSTEKTNQKSSTFETKSLLHLLNYHSQKDEIDFYVIDFYNDVTGVDSSGTRAWDVQSKGEQIATAKKVGKYLVTLFKNFLSTFTDSFQEYILFVENIKSDLLVNPNLKCFKIENFNSIKHDDIKNGLLEESKKKSYMSEFISDLDDNEIYNKINSFLEVTFFVKDEGKQVTEYVKDVTELGLNVMPSDDKLKKIFDEIKGTQSSLKGILSENMEIDDLMGFRPTKKYLKRENVILVVSSRILNIKGNLEDVNPSSYNINLSRFTNEEDKKDHLDDCRNGIYRLMFDRNNAHAYWVFFEEVWLKTKSHRHSSVDSIYNLLDQNKVRPTRIDFDSVKFFISIVKDGLI